MSKNQEGKVQAVINQPNPNLNDVLSYKQILKETMEQCLIDFLLLSEESLLGHVKDSQQRGINTLRVIFCSESIYESFMVIDNDLVFISLDLCIQEYIYEDKLLGIYRKQIKFTDINYKEIYKRVSVFSDLNFQLSIVNEIINDEPKIADKIRAYYEKLGFDVKQLDKKNTFSLELSW